MRNVPLDTMMNIAPDAPERITVVAPSITRDKCLGKNPLEVPTKATLETPTNNTIVQHKDTEEQQVTNYGDN